MLGFEMYHVNLFVILFKTVFVFLRMKNWAVSCPRCWRKVCLPDWWYWFDVCLWKK